MLRTSSLATVSCIVTRGKLVSLARHFVSGSIQDSEMEGRRPAGTLSCMRWQQRMPLASSVLRDLAMFLLSSYEGIMLAMPRELGEEAMQLLTSCGLSQASADVVNKMLAKQATTP